MAPLILLTPSDDVVTARRARLRERLMARLSAPTLDSELARGVAPGTRAALALRAERLGHPRARTFLARQLRRLLENARRPPRHGMARVPSRRGELLAATEQLEALALRLLEPGLVSARGVAQVRLLLSDGSSPIYSTRASEDIGTAAARALEALHPSFTW